MRKKSKDLSTLRQRPLDEDYKSIFDFARRKKLTLSFLTALTHDKNQIHAIQVTGLVANVIAERDSEYIRNYLLRLFWLVNDESGGIGWRAPELIGEILHHCPNFDQSFPKLILSLDLEQEDAPRFRTGTLWAIGRVAQDTRDACCPSYHNVSQLIPRN